MIAKFRQYFNILGVLGTALAVLGKIRGKCLLVKVSHSEIRSPIFLRVPSTDVESFNKIFIRREYEFNVKAEPRVILDAGANIGLTAVFFANRYPDASIIAVEPEESNLEILRRNIGPYPNITCVPGALWDRNETIDLIDPGLGKWGFITRARKDSGQNRNNIVDQVQGMTVEAIMAEHSIDRIDILKMDIEGAEREVFQDCGKWIERTGAIVIEIHDHLKPGCEESVSSGTSGFYFKWQQGENFCLARKDGCLAPTRD